VRAQRRIAAHLQAVVYGVLRLKISVGFSAFISTSCLRPFQGPTPSHIRSCALIAPLVDFSPSWRRPLRPQLRTPLRTSRQVAEAITNPVEQGR
jgi:hypothetical protein